MNEEQMRAVQAIDDYFKSGNSVPVSRATIKREEWERVKATLVSQAKSVPGCNHVFIAHQVAAERERWQDAVMRELDSNGQAHAIVAAATFEVEGAGTYSAICSKCGALPSSVALSHPTDDRVREMMLKACELRDKYSAAGYTDASYQVSDESIVDEVLAEAKKEANK